MRWTKRLISILLLVLIGSCSPAPEKDLQRESIAVKDHLLDVNTLLAIRDQDSIKIIDFRRPQEYAKNHIPKSINIWRPHIEQDSLPVGGIKASRDKLQTLFSSLGIGSNDYLVIYDNNGSCDAARLWWLLHHYGYTKAALLNGGLKAWSESSELTTEITSYERTSFKLPDYIPLNGLVSLESLERELDEETLMILDTRSTEEYEGKYIKKGAFDMGRIPGSINIDWVNSIDMEKQTFKTKSELTALFHSIGVDSTSNIVTYCHSGVRSSHTYFVLTQLLGYQNVRNYDGSWIEWSYHNMPLERGSKIAKK